MSGVALYVAQNAEMKRLALTMGAYSAVFWRTAGAGILSGLLFARAKRPLPRGRALTLHVVRGANTSVMAVAFFYALTSLPLAHGIALSFIGPLLAVFLARVWLGEAVGRSAYAGAAIGFLGMIVLVLGHAGQSTADPSGLAAMTGAAFLWACNLVLMRRQAMTCAAREIAFFGNLTMSLFLAPGLLMFGTVPKSAEWPGTLLAAVLSVGCFVLIAWANGRQESSRLVSIEYSALLWAALFGWLLFDEPMEIATIAGSAMIIAGCLLAARARQSCGRRTACGAQPDRAPLERTLDC